jgi:alpha-tubulin suppressor-like RCC1 family protein
MNHIIHVFMLVVTLLWLPMNLEAKDPTKLRGSSIYDALKEYASKLNPFTPSYEENNQETEEEQAYRESYDAMADFYYSEDQEANPSSGPSAGPSPEPWYDNPDYWEEEWPSMPPMPSFDPDFVPSPDPTPIPYVDPYDAPSDGSLPTPSPGFNISSYYTSIDPSTLPTTPTLNDDTTVSGNAHQCSISSDQVVYCWGSNNLGQLGNGTTTNSATPVPILTISNIVGLTAGYNHTCALNSTGNVYCWGDNTYGQLGISSFTGQTSPTLIVGLNNIQSLAYIDNAWHTCAIDTSGDVYCWGYNGSGQLGDGTSLTRNTPVMIEGLTSITNVTIGSVQGNINSGYTCSLSSSNSAYCFGDYTSFLAPDPAGVSKATTPTLIDGLDPVIDFAAGYSHSCGLIGADGSVNCWGANGYGQIGDGTVIRRVNPTAATGVSSTVHLDNGRDHSCALGSDGTLYCWGGNGSGQLGAGNALRQTGIISVTGVPTTISSFSLGFEYTCAITTDNNPYCWGYNGYGQLGDGTTINRLSPVAVQGLPASSANFLIARYTHSCSIMNNGDLYCWGNNEYGQLGDGTTVNKLSATYINGVSNAIDVTTGYFHTCALTSDGTLYCWGLNNFGQFGDGTTNPSLTPVEIGNYPTAASLGSGGYHTCMVFNDGSISCWGRNLDGELGDGTTNNAYSPISISGISEVAALDGGGTHTCAITTSGGMYCWGNNNKEQLSMGGQIIDFSLTY